MMFDSLITLLHEEGISDTIQCLENRGANHEWNVIGLDVGTESERWYYLDGANRVYLFGYEHGILKSSTEMFAYTLDVPENEDGTYTVTLYDGTEIHLQGASFLSDAIHGDVDVDGVVDISDATAILTCYAQYAAGLESSREHILGV